MRKQVFGRKFKRDANERKALFKGLINELVLRETIKTTEAKAKAIRSQVEKLVTKAKVRGQEARMFLQPYLREEAILKVLTDLAPRFSKRNGGYVRLIKLGTRFGDNARMVVMEWVEKAEGTKVPNESSIRYPQDKKEPKGEKKEATVKVSKSERKTTEKKSAKIETKKKETKKGATK